MVRNGSGTHMILSSDTPRTEAAPCFRSTRETTYDIGVSRTRQSERMSASHSEESIAAFVQDKAARAQ